MFNIIAAAKSLQSCPTLCDPIDGSPPGSPVPGILQARTLEWVAISFSNAWKWKVKVKSLSRVWLIATPWTAAHQAPRSVGFSRQEYWSGVALPSPKNTLEGINSRISEAEEWISELEDKMVEITAKEQDKEERMKRSEDSLRDLWDHIKRTNIRIIGVSEKGKKKKV